MKKIKRLRIVTVRRAVCDEGQRPLRRWCAVCGRETEMLAKKDAALLLEVSFRELDELIAKGRVHAIRTITGGVRVCQESIFLS